MEQAPVPGRPMALHRLLRPRSVAIVGASEDRPSTARLLANLRAYGFAGETQFVNPARADQGYLRSVRDLASPVDLAVIAVGAHRVPDVMEECGELGIPAAIILAAGFSEIGPQGQALQEDLVRRADRLDMRFLGPNCNGMLNIYDRAVFTTSNLPAAAFSEPGPTSFVSQSGWVLAAILKYTLAWGYSVGMTVSTGNEANVTVEDIVDELVADPSVRSIGLYMEQIRTPRRLVEIADRAARNDTAITLLRGGRSVRGAQAAATHTGAMAGSGRLAEALLAEYGVRLATSVTDLAATAHALGVGRRYHGRVASISSSGGGKVLIADALDEVAVPLASLSEDTVSRLRPLLPDFAVIENPLDPTAGLIDQTAYGQLVEAVVSDPDVGAIALQVPANPGIAAARYEQVAAFARRSSKSFVAIWQEVDVDERVRSMLLDAGVVVVPEHTACVRALAALRDDDSVAAVPAVPGNIGLAGEVLASISAEIEASGRSVDEEAAKRIVAAAGLKLPNRTTVSSWDEIPGAVRAVGYPLYLKLVADAMVHKAAIGGVRWVATPDDLGRQMAALRAAASAAGMQRTRITIERSVAPIAEFFLGLKHDPQVGPVIMVGAGGRFSEALADIAVGRPVGADDAAERLLLKTRYGRAVHASVGRGVPVHAWRALQRAIRVISALAVQVDSIAELDINPVALVDEADGAVALDAAICIE
jgi:acetate---CoA ligase (ADP-forming)